MDNDNTTPLQQNVMPPTFVSVDQEVLRRCIIVAESAADNARECLNTHDNTVGRTTRKNRTLADLYEREIKAAGLMVMELRQLLGWPTKEQIHGAEGISPPGPQSTSQRV